MLVGPYDEVVDFLFCFLRNIINKLVIIQNMKSLLEELVLGINVLYESESESALFAKCVQTTRGICCGF